MRTLDLRALRDGLNLTQEEAARRSGLKQTTISALELGKIRDPHLSTITQLARGYKVTATRVLRCLRQTIRDQRSRKPQVRGVA